MFTDTRLSDLPGYAKLFVAVFTALMLCVCFWAAALYTVDKGVVDPNNLPAYLQAVADKNIPHHTDTTSEAFDTLPVMAPVWDSTLKGQEMPLDSISAESLRVVGMAKETVFVDTEHESKLRENLGLAHTHINGQTLLYFAFGFIFLFTSATASRKKLVYWVFGIAILVHNIGLTGQGYCWVFDDLLALSGVVILLTIAYMAMLIFADLGKSPRTR